MPGRRFLAFLQGFDSMASELFVVVALRVLHHLVYDLLRYPDLLYDILDLRPLGLFLLGAQRLFVIA